VDAQGGRAKSVPVASWAALSPNLHKCCLMGVKMALLSGQSRKRLPSSAIRPNLVKQQIASDLLAKEKVASSNLVFRSKVPEPA